MTDDTAVLHTHHIHTALHEAVKAMKRREEHYNGKGWCSTERSVLEDALKALNEGKPLSIIRD